MILHGKALLGTDFNTKIAHTAFEAVDLPLLGFLRNNNGVSRAPPTAHSARNARVDIVLNLSPGNLGKHSFPFRVHEGCRTFDQVPGHSSHHGKQFHFLFSPSPFRATDTRIQRQDDIGYISKFRALEHFNH